MITSQYAIYRLTTDETAQKETEEEEEVREEQEQEKTRKRRRRNIPCVRKEWIKNKVKSLHNAN